MAKLDPGVNTHSDSQQRRNKNKVDNAELEKDHKLWRLKPTFWLFKTGSTNSSSAFHLIEDQLLLCGTRLRGYSLKFKQWVSFDVDNIKDIAWNDKAFSKLMLPGGYQNLILSFVEV